MPKSRILIYIFIFFLLFASLSGSLLIGAGNLDVLRFFKESNNYRDVTVTPKSIFIQNTHKIYRNWVKDIGLGRIYFR